MKTHSKRIILTGASVALLLSGSPVAVDAVPSENNSQNFCARIVNLTGSNQDAIEARLQTMRSNFSTRLSQMTGDQNSRDKNIAEARTAAKEKFEQRIATLLARDNLSEDQIQAINEFRTNVVEAEATRETAVDQARQTYRSSLSNIIAAQQNSLTQAANTYQEAISNAFTEATSNCEDGTQSLADLRTAVKNARQNLTAKRNNNQVSEDIRSIAEARRIAIQAANQAFRDSIKEYSATLNTALTSTDDDPSPDPQS